jgi:hypothetical protein
MMNEPLKKEIINHIFNKFGLLTSGEAPASTRKKDELFSNKFLSEHKISFEVEGKEYSNNVWSGETDIDGSRVQFIIGDLTEDVPEYSLLLQLDAFPPYAARISLDPEDTGSLYFKIDERWIEASTLFQAKILVAVESLMDLYVTWDKNSNIESIHKDLIEFLKSESDNNE